MHLNHHRQQEGAPEADSVCCGEAAGHQGAKAVTLRGRSHQQEVPEGDRDQTDCLIRCGYVCLFLLALTRQLAAWLTHSNCTGLAHMATVEKKSLWLNQNSEEFEEQSQWLPVSH